MFVTFIAALCIAGPAAASERLNVVTSFSILEDIVRQIAGDRVEVRSIVGIDADAHTYSPKPDDVRTIAAADLIIVNGLGLEGWLDRLIAASGAAAPIVVASADVMPLQGGDHSHGVDPHAWQDVANILHYTFTIQTALCDAAPQQCALFTDRVDRYGQRLRTLDSEIKSVIGSVPADRRRIITSHSSLGYFARAYGVTVLSPQGVSTESEASARDVARLIRQIRAENVPAVFMENITDPRLLEQIARETDAVVLGPLYSDALSGPDGPAGTYIDMMRHNLKLLAKGMAGL
jgi:zinc/manganese transport system substrate-binding protein